MNKERETHELEEVLDVLAKRLPDLLSTLRNTLYSKEAGESLGKATGVFFKELKAAGLDDDQAFQLTRDYLAVIKNMGNMMDKGSQKTGNGFHFSTGDHGE